MIFSQASISKRRGEKTNLVANKSNFDPSEQLVHKRSSTHFATDARGFQSRHGSQEEELAHFIVGSKALSKVSNVYLFKIPFFYFNSKSVWFLKQ